jgi:cobalt/nickel transport system permease protein
VCKTDARLKLIFVMMVLVLGLLAQSTLFSLSQALVALAMLAGARPTRRRLKLLLFPFLFVCLFLLAHTFFTPGHRQLLVIAGIRATYSPAGLAFGLLLASRVAAGTLIFFWYVVTTEFPQIRDAMIWLRVPEPVVGMLAMTWRYLAVYEEDVGRMKSARTLRLGFQGWHRSLASLTAIGGQTVLRAFDHSERTYRSMRIRGYNGRVVAPPVQPLSKADFLQASALWLIAALLMGLYFRV